MRSFPDPPPPLPHPAPRMSSTTEKPWVQTHGCRPFRSPLPTSRGKRGTRPCLTYHLPGPLLMTVHRRVSIQHHAIGAAQGPAVEHRQRRAHHHKVRDGECGQHQTAVVQDEHAGLGHSHAQGVLAVAGNPGLVVRHEDDGKQAPEYHGDHLGEDPGWGRGGGRAARGEGCHTHAHPTAHRGWGQGSLGTTQAATHTYPQLPTPPPKEVQRRSRREQGGGGRGKGGGRPIERTTLVGTPASRSTLARLTAGKQTRR
jgi:hypothetical protein